MIGNTCAFATPVALYPRAIGCIRAPIRSSFTTTFHRGNNVSCSKRIVRRTLRMHHSGDSATSTVAYTSDARGTPESTEYRLFLALAGHPISPWHDIPIYPDPKNNKVVNFVNEIPKGTQAKMEIATDEAQNPIKQDVKKGALRFYKYGPSLINYGAVPQTFEDPGNIHPDVNVGGDGDPIDFLDIGDTVQPSGAVYPAKILGALALLDEGEIDWKIIGISTADPVAHRLEDIADVEQLFPGKISAIREWFRLYKTAEGKGENQYAYDGNAKGAHFAVKVVAENHESWAQLRSGDIENNKGYWLK